MISIALIVASLSTLAIAQAPEWGQCGGQNWPGPFTCVSGTTCIYINPWHSQCLANTSSSTVASSTIIPSTTSAAPTPTTSPPPAKAKYWFSFGDSYTQTGFDVNGTLPSLGNPLGNPTYPGWTSAGGANWIDYVTTVYNKTLTLTYNFAYGGATIDAALVTPYEPTVRSLTDQVNNFLATVGKKPATTPWTSANSIFSFWIGINDLGNSWYQPGDRGAFSDTLLNAEFALIQKLYDAGARNFLFINVPPTERSPYMQGALDKPSQAVLKSVIDGFNTRLTAKIASFKSSHSGVKTKAWNSHALFAKILNKPQAYGFKDNSTYGSASDVFWFNDYHPSAPGHKFFAKEIGALL